MPSGQRRHRVNRPGAAAGYPTRSSMPRTGAASSSRDSFWLSTSVKRRRSPVMLASPARHSRGRPSTRCLSLNSKACTPACRSRRNRAQRSSSGSSALSRYATVSISVSKSQRSRKRSRGTNALRGAACRASAMSRSSTRARTEAPRHAGARQTQQFPHPGHAHGAQGVQPLRHPRTCKRWAAPPVHPPASRDLR